MPLTDQQLENARRGDTSQIEALVEEVGQLRHTPGPWEEGFEEIADNGSYSEPLVWADPNRDGNRVHVAKVRIGLPETEANCRLIAIAPELAKALSDARAEVERARVERDNWQRDAERQLDNAQFYRGIVVKIGEMFGDAAKVQDDGGMAEGVLCLKVPDLVERLRRENEALRKEHEAGSGMMVPLRPPAAEWLAAWNAAKAMLESSHG